MACDHRPMASSTHPGSGAESSEEVRRFLASELRFATMATIRADGSPLQAVVWFVLDEETLVVNGAESRAWVRNARRDPRVSIAVEDGGQWVSIEGRAEIGDDQPAAQADAAEGARLYHADQPEVAETLIRDRFETQRRISLRLRLANGRLLESGG